MPFDARNLSALESASSFTIWLYTTPDTRAAVLAPGYFASAAGRLLPGSLILLQSSDSLSFVPIRSNGEVGNGLVLDAAAPAIRITASAALAMLFTMNAAAVQTRTVALDPVPAGLYIGRSFTVAARVTGPVATLVFSILDAAGATVAGPVSVSALSGSASVTFTAPEPGSGYRVKVQDADDALVTQTSASFVVTEPYVLLTESGGSLTGENGGELLV